MVIYVTRDKLEVLTRLYLDRTLCLITRTSSEVQYWRNDVNLPFLVDLWKTGKHCMQAWTICTERARKHLWEFIFGRYLAVSLVHCVLCSTLARGDAEQTLTWCLSERYHVSVCICVRVFIQILCLGFYQSLRQALFNTLLVSTCFILKIYVLA